MCARFDGRCCRRSWSAEISRAPCFPVTSLNLERRFTCLSTLGGAYVDVSGDQKQCPVLQAPRLGQSIGSHVQSQTLLQTLCCKQKARPAARGLRQLIHNTSPVHSSARRGTEPKHKQLIASLPASCVGPQVLIYEDLSFRRSSGGRRWVDVPNSGKEGVAVCITIDVAE